MAGGGGEIGKGRRKGVMDLNLTPFIDLFSTLIIFLITTAVWDELAAVKLSMGVPKGGSPSPITVPKEDIKEIKSDVKITVRGDSIVMFDAGQQQVLQKTADGYDFQPVQAFIENVRSRYAEKKDMLIFATDDAKYEDVVGVMDRSLAQAFDELIVTGEGTK